MSNTMDQDTQPMGTLEEIPEEFWTTGRLHFKFDEHFDLQEFARKYPTSQVVSLGGLNGWEYHINQRGEGNIRGATSPKPMDQIIHPAQMDPVGDRKKSIAWGYVIRVDAETEKKLDEDYLQRPHFIKAASEVLLLDTTLWGLTLLKPAFFYYNNNAKKDYNSSVLNMSRSMTKRWLPGLKQLQSAGAFLGVRMDIIEVLRMEPRRPDQPLHQYYYTMAASEFAFYEAELASPDDVKNLSEDFYSNVTFVRFFPSPQGLPLLPPGPESFANWPPVPASPAPAPAPVPVPVPVLSAAPAVYPALGDQYVQGPADQYVQYSDGLYLQGPPAGPGGYPMQSPDFYPPLQGYQPPYPADMYSYAPDGYQILMPPSTHPHPFWNDGGMAAPPPQTDPTKDPKEEA